MSIFYSRANSGFYSEDLHGPRTLPGDGPESEAVANPNCKIPLDAVEITAEAHAALLEGQAAGKVIGADAQGWPMLKDPPAIAFALLKAQELANFRADREKMLNRLAGIGMAAQVGGDIALAAAVAAFRQGLLDLPGHTTVTAATDIEGLRLALKTRYSALLAATPTSAKLAFKGVDA